MAANSVRVPASPTLRKRNNKLCSVPQCSNRFSSDISIHQFPIEKGLRKHWAHVLRIGKLVSRYMVVCSEHFVKDDYILLEVHGYTLSLPRTCLMWTAVVLTLGILRLMFHWVPHWQVYASHVRCTLQSADIVVVVDNYKGKFKSYFVKRVKTLSVKRAFSDMVDEYDTTDEKYDIYTKSSNITQPSKLRIHLINGTYRDVVEVRAVWVKKLCYIWDEESNSFVCLAGLEQGFASPDFQQCRGLSVKEQIARRITYGKNEMAVPMQSITTLIFLELLNPFYFFQFFTICVWLFEGYTYYPIAIIFMSIFGVASAVVQTRKSQRLLYGTVHASDIITVSRGNDTYEDVPSSHLVPGDVIIIPPGGCQMHCDAVLISGQCVLNESMLTGESVPVTKTPLPTYEILNYSPHTLFCGTRVIQSRSQGRVHLTRAVVTRTGFLTAKGSLVRSILYPPPADYRFEKDTYKFIGILAVIAAAGTIYTVVIKSQRGIAVEDLVIKALDIITITIPPALPAAMTVGKMFAQMRLQAAEIYCLNPRVINVAGGINCVCFDKTGTLTEDGLDFRCVVPNSLDQDDESPLVKGMATCHALTYINASLAGDPLDIKMFEASGWILKEEEENLYPTVVKPTHSRKSKTTSLTNNPNKSRSGTITTSTNSIRHEVETQNYTQARTLSLAKDEEQVHPDTLESKNSLRSEVEEENVQIIIIHQFPFESSLQRMSVITREGDSKNVILYTKGSPEMIFTLCNSKSVPLNMQSALRVFTSQGFRVIAVSRRVCIDQTDEDVLSMSRESVEMDLEFLGLVVLENRLKPETTPVIQTLKEANIRPIMVTGDNILTAISVAKECGILDQDDVVVELTANKGFDGKKPHFNFTTLKPSPETHDKSEPENDSLAAGLGYKLAITGSSWSVIRKNFPDLLPRLLVRGAVFARMTSEQKQQLILAVQEYGYCVAMCGDGANDCAALKAANVGISLSEEESSVASPLTSKIPNISCVPLTIREGRASLTTAFGIFKFMILYSLVEVTSAILLYGIDSNLADLQFLFIDIFLIVHFAILFGRTEAYPGPLSTNTPTMRLLSSIPLLSLTLLVVIMGMFQVIAFHLIRNFPWYKAFQFDPVTNSYMCYENYAVFVLSLFQYIIMAVIFSKGYPYRKPIYTNFLLMFSLILMTAVCVYITVYPALWLSNLLEIQLPPTYDFRLIILGLGVGNFIIAYISESFLVDFLISKKCLKIRRNPISSKRFLVLERELQIGVEWLTPNKSNVI